MTKVRNFLNARCKFTNWKDIFRIQNTLLGIERVSFINKYTICRPVSVIFELFRLANTNCIKLIKLVRLKPEQPDRLIQPCMYLKNKNLSCTNCSTYWISDRLWYMKGKNTQILKVSRVSINFNENSFEFLGAS